MSARFWSLVALALVPLVANWPLVSGWLIGDPVYTLSRLGMFQVPGPIPGVTSIDPSAGLMTEALGRAAAFRWLHGHIPWWNPFNGIGLPLAAEGQNQALFLPFVLLFALRNGPLLVLLAIEEVAGFATYALLRQLALTRFAAWIGAALFALNGTFAWFGHSPIMPVAFAPMLLLGIEMEWKAIAEQRASRGWIVVAIALAFSLYAGFPETAYLDGLLCAAWTLLRLTQCHGAARARFAGRVGLGALVGLLLATPYIVPFAHLLSVGQVNLPRMLDFSAVAIPLPALPVLLMPYLLGPQSLVLDWNRIEGALWSYLGGYLTPSIVLLAIVAVIAGRAPGRALRWLLAGWCVVMIGASFGVPGVARAVYAFPALKETMVFRYSPPSWELAAIILAAMAIDDWQHARIRRRGLAVALAITLVASVAALAAAWNSIVYLWANVAHSAPWIFASVGGAVAVALAAAALLAARPVALRSALLGALITGESIVLFSVPRLAGLRHAELDTGPIEYLQQHLERTGSLFLEIPRFDTDFLYTTGLAAGLGSNDIGLDRGLEGGAHVVSFERIGPKVLMVQGNESFRSSSSNPAERRSVEDSFAKSVLWGFTVAAESNGHVLVDASDFFLRDGQGAGAALRPGTYRVDRTRSAFYLERTKAFPKNSEIEVTLTFANETSGGGRGGGGGPAQGPPAIGAGGAGGGGGRGGGLFSGSVASVTPVAEAVTLREHYSLVELPDGNYTPRLDDPRAGYGGLEYVDYSTPIGEPMVKRYVHRHRIVKKDPNAAISDPVEPIRYWVDPGAPADVRQALVEGASWWNQAFEAAGFHNGFLVAVLPEGADPMDIRYNMINWVHRSTRGWSTGGTVSDPRTGEIIKGTVTLGSLRDRQDYMIFEGLLSPYINGTEKPDILYQSALARIRQLAAHEVGHTLGLGHNYYDSSKGWISVMDYPHPQEELRADGTIDISHAYPARIGDWDKVTINYGYRQLPKGDEAAALGKILDDAWAQDLRYLTNQDLGAHPHVDQWSNGVNQADELDRIMKIRRAALDKLGEHTIRIGAPMATIEEPLVPIFMYHRYTVESTSHIVAGQDYIYAMRGDGRTPTKWVPAADQRKALDSLASTLKPSELTVPKQILDAIPPRPPGFGRHRELFPSTTGTTFDPLSPATVAADVTIGFVLQLDRASRMVAQHAEDPTLPGLEEVIDRLAKAVFDAPAATPYEQEVRRAEERVLVDRVIWLASGSPNPQVRAVASYKLGFLLNRAMLPPNDAERAQRMLLSADIKRFLDRPADPLKPIYAAEAPPGAPIGGDTGMDWLAPVPFCNWSDAHPDWWVESPWLM